MDYLKIGNVEYRIEANWNAITAFLSAKGTDSLQALSDFQNLKPSDITTLMAACINEGARMDGKDIHFDALRIGEMCGINEIAAFINIYARQSNPAMKPEKENKKKE